MGSTPQIDEMIDRLNGLRDKGKRLSLAKQEAILVDVLDMLDAANRIIDGQRTSQIRLDKSRNRAWVRVKAHEARTAAALRLRRHLVPDVDGGDVLVIRSASLDDILQSPLYDWSGQPSLAEVEAKDD